MSKAEAYRQMIDDVVANRHLLEDDERDELRDLLARIERRSLAAQPATEEPAA